MVTVTKSRKKSSNLDADLDSLLASARRNNDSSHRSSHRASMLSLDHLTKTKWSIPSLKSAKHDDTNGSLRCDGFGNYLRMLCYFYPKSCGCVLLTVLAFCMAFLASYIHNPWEYFGGDIHVPHTHLHSKYDIKMSSIDHWCLGGGDSGCSCEDPTVPLHRADHRSWLEALEANRKMIFDETRNNTTIDVAFLGESLVEAMDGRWMGRAGRNAGMQQMEDLFRRHFDGPAHSSFKGLALGIAGDTAPNVLFRLMHGELPEYFYPKVWWLVLGSNDLGRMQCSEEVVALGILRIVEELLEKRPHARIVINSLLPMTDLRGGLYPVISDYQDSFIKKKEHGHHHRERQLRPWGRRYDPPRGGPVDVVQMEELRRDKQARIEAYYKRHKIDSRLFDRNRVRSHGFVGRENRKPLWTSIKSINAALEEFASSESNVDYFEATPLFTTPNPSRPRELQLLTDRITMRGHVTAAGFEVWESAMVDFLRPIVEQMDSFDRPSSVQQVDHQTLDPKEFQADDDFNTQSRDSEDSSGP